MVYTTRDNVESFLRTTFDADSTPTATEVDNLVSKVDDAVDHIIGSTWTEQNDTQTFDLPNPRNRFVTRKFPLISVNSVEYNTGDEFNPTWEPVNNYRIVGNMIFTEKLYEGNQKIKVDYQWGHSTVPMQIEQLATLLIVRYIVFGDDTTNNAFEDISVGGLSISRNVGMSRLNNIGSQIEQLKSEISKKKAYAFK